MNKLENNLEDAPLTAKEVKQLAHMPDTAMAKMAELSWVGEQTASGFTRTDNRNRSNLEKKLKCMTELALHGMNDRHLNGERLDAVTQLLIDILCLQGTNMKSFWNVDIPREMMERAEAIFADMGIIDRLIPGVADRKRGEQLRDG